MSYWFEFIFLQITQMAADTREHPTSNVQRPTSNDKP